MAGEHGDAISRIDDLIATVRFNSICYVVQAQMYLLLGNSQMEGSNYEDAIYSFRRARANIRHHTSRSLSVITLISGWKFDELGVTIRQRLCEALCKAGRTKDAGESLLEMIKTFDKAIYMSRPVTEWISRVAHQCLSAPEGIDDAALKATACNKARVLHATVNSLIPSPLLTEWAKATLTSVSWKNALVAATDFMVPLFTTYRAICEHLEEINCIMDASECFRHMVDELAEQTSTHIERAEWVFNFRCRCSKKLEDLGDAAMKADRHHDAISRYSSALSLNPATPQGLLTKRSRAYVASGSLNDALNDANRVIMLGPLSPWGYERKHAAPHGVGDYENAIDAFKTMLSMMSRSSDPEIRGLHCCYVNPGTTRLAIQKAVQKAIRDSPRVLINTTSGQLLNKSEQAAAFESLPIFNELVSSMTTDINHSRIVDDVTQYYRYAMFSHRWEVGEPLFEKVIHIVVYNLDNSPTHEKLKVFCKIVWDAGLHWAWSDTCCINQADHNVLQEALVAMFRWYQGSAVTIIFLRGVRSPSHRGDLVGSIWNTHAWTLQEYHASKVVRFYNEDWTLYLNLDIPNHKDSREIISEMEEATGVSARTLTELQPGFNNIREKLSLASTRQTTRVEDTAYSLLGIFSISLSVVYGEGHRSLGRLLAQLLTNSGDASILAWTGRSGQFNSCLPTDISVFSKPPTEYIPPTIKDTQIDGISARLCAPPLNFPLVTKLYDRLHELPLPSFAGQRMKLPCIAFKLERLWASWNGPEKVFRAHTTALGIVEIHTKEELSRLGTLCLVHPWIDFLLDRQPIDSAKAANLENSTDSQFSLINQLPGPSKVTSAQRIAAHLFARLGHSFATWPRGSDATLCSTPSSLSLTDKQAQALQFIARLRQPFGALLLTQNRQNVEEYRRVAAKSMIKVQVQEDIPLNELIDGVRLMDVL